MQGVIISKKQLAIDILCRQLVFMHTKRMLQDQVSEKEVCGIALTLYIQLTHVHILYVGYSKTFYVHQTYFHNSMSCMQVDTLSQSLFPIKLPLLHLLNLK